MDQTGVMAEAGKRNRFGFAETAETRSARDLVLPSIVAGALLLLVYSGGAVISIIARQLHGWGDADDGVLPAAMLLNAALFIFAWRRYRALERETAARTAAEARTHALASRDPLTGFHNRRALVELAGGALAQAERRGRAIALIMIDLDKFKTVNDLYGHMIGDRLLAAAAESILAVLPPGTIAARLGGDEFACTFPFDPSYPAMVEGIAEHLVTTLAKPFLLGKVHAHISASLGIARSDADCPTIDQLMRRADIAMYDAKKAGRNRFCWFDARMEQQLQARLDIEQGLRIAIPAGHIVPYYEQQIDLQTGMLTGFEVLARWEHPEQGLIPPDAFIPIAEEGGLIADLSHAVMRTAFEQARGWDPELTLSVNVAPSQLKDPWFAQKIVKLLTETGFPPRRLEIEITETSLFENLGLAQSIIGSLKNQGIRIALDDFGTGYSSLAHLLALPFDRIKIDKSFVTSMETNSESAAIVDAITKLGASLGLPITAEGIENDGIEARLIALGCRKGQGYYFGRPMNIGQVRAMLAARAQLVVLDVAPEPELRRAV